MRFRFTLLLTLLASLPIGAQKLEVPYRLFTLENGLTVILHQD